MTDSLSTDPFIWSAVFMLCCRCRASLMEQEIPRPLQVPAQGCKHMQMAHQRQQDQNHDLDQLRYTYELCRQ